MIDSLIVPYVSGDIFCQIYLLIVNATFDCKNTIFIIIISMLGVEFMIKDREDFRQMQATGYIRSSQSNSTPSTKSIIMSTVFL